MTMLSDAKRTLATALRLGHAETIIYRPRGLDPEADGRSIAAIVDRSPPVPLPGSNAPAAQFTIEVANDAETGISSSEVDTGGDQVVFARRIGQSPAPMNISQIISQDEGMLRLGVR